MLKEVNKYDKVKNYIVDFISYATIAFFLGFKEMTITQRLLISILIGLVAPFVAAALKSLIKSFLKPKHG